MPCKDILERGDSIGDGIYQANFDGQLNDVYCNMTINGGGWTLVSRWKKH